MALLQRLHGYRIGAVYLQIQVDIAALVLFGVTTGVAVLANRVNGSIKKGTIAPVHIDDDVVFAEVVRGGVTLPLETPVIWHGEDAGFLLAIAAEGLNSCPGACLLRRAYRLRLYARMRCAIMLRC